MDSVGRAFNARHADQHHAQATVVEGGAQLLQAVHGKPVCFIDDDQARWVGDEPQLRFALFKDLEIRRSEGNRTAMDVARVSAVLRTQCFVAPPDLLKASARLIASRSLRCARHDLTGATKIVADLRRRRDHIGCVEEWYPAAVRPRCERSSGQAARCVRFG